MMASIAIHRWSMGHFEYSTYIQQNVWRSGHNSAHGWSLKYCYTIHANKTVNYIYLTVAPINQVGDAIIDQMGHSSINIRSTGPIPPEKEYQVYYENIWYTTDIIKPIFIEAVLRYSDGTEESATVFTERNYNDIDYFLPPRLQNHHSSSSGNTGSSNSGCYIATAVYGSYDCPQVWTLRRYRDSVLSRTWYGRTFIKVYYSVSPSLVRLFGKTGWFKRIWKHKLDKMVLNLNAKGIKNTPYIDK